MAGHGPGGPDTVLGQFMLVLRILVIIAGAAQVCLGLLAILGQLINGAGGASGAPGGAQAAAGASLIMAFVLAGALAVAGLCAIISTIPSKSTTSLRVCSIVLNSIILALFTCSLVVVIGMSGTQAGAQIPGGAIGIIILAFAIFLAPTLFNVIAVPILGKHFANMTPQRQQFGGFDAPGGPINPYAAPPPGGTPPTSYPPPPPPPPGGYPPPPPQPPQTGPDQIPVQYPPDQNY